MVASALLRVYLNPKLPFFSLSALRGLEGIEWFCITHLPEVREKENLAGCFNDYALMYTDARNLSTFATVCPLP